MNPEIKDKWTKALRSGRYQQGALCLRTKWDLFCCLGVLCDLHSKETGNEWSLLESQTTFSYGLDPCSGTVVPSNEVRAWAGISLEQQYELVLLNDTKGMSFNRIASYIEEKL